MSQSDVPVQVIVAAFPELNGASTALRELMRGTQERLITIEDTAVITKDDDGTVKIKETADMGGGRGATIGAIAGGVLGLLTGPVGWAALGGGVIGGLAAKLRDSGFPDARLRQLGEQLPPKSSALIAVIEHRWVADVERALAQQGADVLRHALHADLARQLTAGGDVAYTVVATGDAVYAGSVGGERTLPADAAPSSTPSAASQLAAEQGGGAAPPRTDATGSGDGGPVTH